LLAAQAATEAITAYELNIDFSDTEVGYWTVTGGPRTTGNLFVQITPGSTDVRTDSAGKITGSGRLLVKYAPASAHFSSFAVEYTGQISSRPGSLPTVSLTIKGNGFTSDGTGQATTTLNSLQLKFTGVPGINPLNTRDTRMVGTLTGSIRGKTPLDSFGTQLPDLPAVITSSSRQSLDISTDVAQSDNRMLLYDSASTGLGTIRDGSYKFTTRGNGNRRGNTLVVNGVMGLYSVDMGTNTVVVSAPGTAQLQGKVNGQFISAGSASRITVRQVDN
jgi:hypothetical protein